MPIQSRAGYAPSCTNGVGKQKSVTPSSAGEDVPKWQLLQTLQLIRMKWFFFPPFFSSFTCKWSRQLFLCSWKVSHDVLRFGFSKLHFHIWFPYKGADKQKNKEIKYVLLWKEVFRRPLKFYSIPIVFIQYLPEIGLRTVWLHKWLHKQMNKTKYEHALCICCKGAKLTFRDIHSWAGSTCSAHAACGWCIFVIAINKMLLESYDWLLAQYNESQIHEESKNFCSITVYIQYLTKVNTPLTFFPILNNIFSLDNTKEILLWYNVK